MLASLADAPLDDPRARLRAEIRRHPRDRRGRCRRCARPRRPPLVAARQRQDRAVPRDRGGAGEVGAHAQPEPLVLDGEIVALDAPGRAGRLPAAAGTHSPRSTSAPQPSTPARSASRSSPSISCATAHRDLRDRPLLERREALERLFANTGSPLLRISEQVRGDGRALYNRR